MSALWIWQFCSQLDVTGEDLVPNSVYLRRPSFVSKIRIHTNIKFEIWYKERYLKSNLWCEFIILTLCRESAWLEIQILAAAWGYGRSLKKNISPYWIISDSPKRRRMVLMLTKIQLFFPPLVTLLLISIPGSSMWLIITVLILC